MEFIWILLLVMVPLLGGGIIALHQQRRRSMRKPPATSAAAPSGTADEQRRRLPHGFGPMGLVLGGALIAAIGLALLVGFPLLRSLLIAFNAPVDAN